MVCHEEDAPVSMRERAECTTGKAAYLEGIIPHERNLLPGYDSGIVLLILGIFFFTAFNFKHYTTFIKTFAQDLLSMRRRVNVYNDHTVSESRILLSLIIVVCFSEAVLLFSMVHVHSSVTSVFPLLLGMIGLTVLYYIVQLLAYTTVGYVFTDRHNSEQWLRGFNASQSLLGITIVIPALLTLFYPATTTLMFGLCAFLYIIARIIFICKGFKIFYNNFLSLLYFILYLCALEIAPLLALYRLRVVFV